ncbi:hypothetical protein J4231_03905 [Candidatus Woesearchaeota archaeon]|nr:hypothetical protein [Candidatus Woesearchaeota archaeon]
MPILQRAQNFEQFLRKNGELSVEGPIIKSGDRIWHTYKIMLDEKPIGEYCEVYELKNMEILLAQCYNGLLPNCDPKKITLECRLKPGESSFLGLYDRLDNNRSIPFP